MLEAPTFELESTKITEKLVSPLQMSGNKLDKLIHVSDLGSEKVEEESLLTEIDSHGTLEHMDSRPPVLATAKSIINMPSIEITDLQTDTNPLRNIPLTSTKAPAQAHI